MSMIGGSTPSILNYIKKEVLIKIGFLVVIKPGAVLMHPLKNEKTVIMLKFSLYLYPP